ncbi:MAG: flavin reductase family protein [Campylobacterota bacterium]|nr:flavin reductase family protein [Campylobacterota bacterium]
MLFDFTETVPLTRYKLMSQSIVPRPIAWIVTESETLNIAPFSFFSGVSSQPPTLMVAIGHKKDGTPKDTLQNIRTTKKCVICSVVTDDMEKMHFTSAELSEHIDEAEKFDIATKKVIDAYPPMIEGVPTAFFCTLAQEISLDGSKTIPLFLTIDHMYVDNEVISDSLKIDMELIGRLGHAYIRPGEKVAAPSIPD